MIDKQIRKLSICLVWDIKKNLKKGGIFKLKFEGTLMCKVAILEKFTLFASGIESLLMHSNECEVIVHVLNCSDLIKRLKEVQPDVIILDLVNGEDSGIRCLQKIRKNFCGIPVLLILSHNHSDCFEDYIRLGAKGFIFNDSNGEELVQAVGQLKNGGEFFQKKVWDIFKTSIQTHRNHRKKDHILTEREVSVLKLFSNGLTYKEIGKKLDISPRTVETHKRNIMEKLKITSTADMVRYTIRNHMIT